MCLAIPMEITEIDGDTAICRLDGVSVSASLSLVPDAKVGDYAVIHAGFAIQILDEEEARETIGLFNQLEEAYLDGLGESRS